MQYVTATIGAVLMFVGCVVGFFLLSAFPVFQGKIMVPLGSVSFTIENPIAFAGIPVGIFAAVHSFRSTLRRGAIKAENSRANQAEPQ